MRILDKSTPVVIALGYFDSVHVGHREVIKRAKARADELNAKLVVFTFSGNLRALTGGDKQKYIFSSSEREKILLSLGADEVYFAPVNREFLSLTKVEFLDKLNALYNIKCYVSGKDYRFGKGATGNVLTLCDYAKDNGQQVLTVDDVLFEGKKVSTTWLKELLIEGDVACVNSLLGGSYSITGEVVHDRGVGRKLGFPTANVNLDKDRQPLKRGVYSGKVKIDNEYYKAVINYGARPTFNQGEEVLEAHILDFNGDIYGKNITVEFLHFIREIKAFSTEEQLKNQLKKDVEKVEKL